MLLKEYFGIMDEGYGNLELIYARDDEGSEHQIVIQGPDLGYVNNIKDSRHEDFIYGEYFNDLQTEVHGLQYNVICIN
jgi:hypothetical protein